MKISVELTLLPLNNEFEESIIQFIKKLRASHFVVLENPLSTQIYGEYDQLMRYLAEEIKTAFENSEHVVMTMKIVKSDRSNYEPHF